MVLLKWISAVFLSFCFFGSFFSLAVQRPTLTQLKTAIEKYNQTASPMEQMDSTLNYELLHDKIPFAPSQPYVVYPDFKEKGGWKYLLGKKGKLTLDELKTAIVHYNKKALQIRQITNSTSYKKFYKHIPYAPHDPSRAYPEFKERGGWDFLLGKTCRKTLALNNSSFFNRFRLSS